MKYSNKQILDSLLNSAGSTAADMTSQLKLYGNGKMDAGIAKVYEAGVGKGSIITASIIGAVALGGIAIKSIVDYCQTKKELSNTPILEASAESDECDSNDSTVEDRSIANQQSESISEE